MARRLLMVVSVLLALLGISQLVIPYVVEHRIEDRLTGAGGNADVSVSAFPAARLLFGDGSRITVTGSGLDLSAQQRAGGLRQARRLRRVDVELDELPSRSISRAVWRGS